MPISGYKFLKKELEFGYPRFKNYELSKKDAACSECLSIVQHYRLIY